MKTVIILYTDEPAVRYKIDTARNYLNAYDPAIRIEECCSIYSFPLAQKTANQIETLMKCDLSKYSKYSYTSSPHIKCSGIKGLFQK